MPGVSVGEGLLVGKGGGVIFRSGRAGLRGGTLGTWSGVLSGVGFVCCCAKMYQHPKPILTNPAIIKLKNKNREAFSFWRMIASV